MKLLLIFAVSLGITVADVLKQSPVDCANAECPVAP